MNSFLFLRCRQCQASRDLCEIGGVARPTAALEVKR